jgi:hypothetical protein
VPADRLLGTFDDLSMTNVRSVPSVPRITSQLPLEETTVPCMVDSLPMVDDDDVDDEDCPCCVVVPAVVPELWAATCPVTPRLRAAPRRNAFRLLLITSPPHPSRGLPRKPQLAATQVPRRCAPVRGCEHEG